MDKKIRIEIGKPQVQIKEVPVRVNPMSKGEVFASCFGNACALAMVGGMFYFFYKIMKH